MQQGPRSCDSRATAKKEIKLEEDRINEELNAAVDVLEAGTSDPGGRHNLIEYIEYK